MLGRVMLVVSLFLGAGFTGCIGASEEVPAAAEEPQKQAGFIEADEANTTAPDGRGDISAYKETNRTEANGTGAMMHSHDYWGQDTRKILTQRDMWFVPLPVAPCREGRYPDGDCYNPGTSIADIDIPAPYLVYEGAAFVEVLFDNFRTDRFAQGPNPAVTMGFDYLTAADEPGNWRVGSAAVTPGTPVIIPVKPTEADMPHQQKSLWLFRIYTDQATSVYFNFTVTAVKGNAIVEWPPHPDLYAEKSERIIFDGPAKTDSRGWADYWISGEDGNWVLPDRVISYGTERVKVEVTMTSFSANGIENAVAPDYFYLDWHNASFIPKMGNGDIAGGRIEGTTADGSTFLFDVPVDNYGMDTPYGTKSRWGFRFMARFSEDACPGVIPSIEQGCQWFPYTIDYTMKITAYGRSISEEGIDDIAELEERSGDTGEKPEDP